MTPEVAALLAERDALAHSRNTHLALRQQTEAALADSTAALVALRQSHAEVYRERDDLCAELNMRDEEVNNCDVWLTEARQETARLRAALVDVRGYLTSAMLVDVRGYLTSAIETIADALTQEAPPCE